MKRTVLLALAFSVSAAFAEKQPISRYQPIIDRQMFGPLPPGFDPTKSPNEVQKSSSKSEKQLSKEQEQLQSAIHFSVINVASDGQTEVGFTDNSDPKAPKHYFMKVGESRDGWTVKEANAENATMTIAKGDIEVSLTLGGNSAKDGGTSKAGGASPAAPTAGGARRPWLFGGGGLTGSSQRARRQRKKDEQAAAEKLRQEQAAAEKLRREEAEQEKQQRDAENLQRLQGMLDEVKKMREASAAAVKSEGESDGAANNNIE